jgi:hypothetical protein
MCPYFLKNSVDKTLNSLQIYQLHQGRDDHSILLVLILRLYLGETEFEIYYIQITEHQQPIIKQYIL